MRIDRWFLVVWSAAFAVSVHAVVPVVRAQMQDSYYDLGDYRRPVTSATQVADGWFQRGLLMCYGFNHEEAVRCFTHALESDPEMAMAHWGIAYALGPNYNNAVMEEDASRQAFESVQSAQRLLKPGSPVEKALIAALSERYAWPAPADRSALEKAYATAMRRAYEAHPDDADVAALFAEALMQLRPWGLWSPEGEPAPETPEIQRVLEAGLKRWPDHPALCHLYIHTMEPSPDPGKALAAANQLRNRVPEAGHLVHMPTHIDVLLGDYETVVRDNQLAIAADRLFVEREGRINFYSLYRMHNYHFLVYGAMFDGQRKLAMQAAEELVREIPAELLADWPDFVEAFVPTPLHVQVRFGRWKEILTVPEPPEEQPYSRAIWHYARTLAFASLGRVADAEAEFAILETSAAAVPESRVLFNNTCLAILGVAVAMAHGEVEYRRGNFEAAFTHLRMAVQLDDALTYDEPWGWMQPARHALGALLLEQGQFEEAERVYRVDLKRHPKNGWALHGLAEALRKQGDNGAASRCDEQLTDSWSRSDINLKASCFCRTGSGSDR